MLLTAFIFFMKVALKLSYYSLMFINNCFKDIR